MSIYIPIIPILWGILGYALIGMALFVPLVLWQARFISSYGTEWQKPAFERVNIWRGIVISALVWPIMLGATIATEVKYRKKGYL